ncbi:hypothetical protein OIA45_40620 (plasmid) [Streptomyces chartreusis]|uniref:hypothetical protein n=1 Tax=Streptomyces chartreusis TaxID=1969 RepID=UPI002F90F192|nr:hypothetical protein OIA45_40620 [Streptomyces chartreusis]
MSTELEHVEVVVGELVEDEDSSTEGTVETCDPVAVAVLKALDKDAEEHLQRSATDPAPA